MIAALGAALLPLAGAPARAQTIENIAHAEWSEDDRDGTSSSNPVIVEVRRPPLSIETHVVDPGGKDTVSLRPSLCQGRELVVAGAGSGQSNTIGAGRASTIRIGNTLLFEIVAPLANRNASEIEQLAVTLVARSGDKETLRVFETGVDTGRFTGAIAVRRAPPVAPGDCVMSVTTTDEIGLGVSTDEGKPVFLTALIDVLADPFGVVFDSEDGTPVDGARVTLVDVATGQPAQVFAEDGMTPWPSTVISGTSVLDGAGNSYGLAPGEYWFPLAATGKYRLKVEPPSPYSGPSQVARDVLAKLPGPDGREFVIVDASFGGLLALDSAEPVQADVPLDRPNVVATVAKTASRARAQPGDPVFYTVTLRNPDPARGKRGVSLVDLPSPWLRLRPSSIRVDGRAAPDGMVDLAPDGRRLSIAIPELAPGGTVKVTYVMTVRPDAPAGQAVNRVEALDSRGGRSVAEASVRVDRETIAARMTIIGRVTEGTCRPDRDRLGIPGVRVMLEDGSFAVTDRDGRYHFEGVIPGTHVVQVQRQTLPEGGTFVDCDRSARSAGSGISRFVIGQGGSLAVADFHASIPGWTPPVAAEVDKGGAPAVADDAVAAPAFRDSAQAAGGGDRDWFAEGNGPPAFLFPEVDHNPRAPAVRVVIRHDPSQTVELLADGKLVDSLAFDGSKTSPDNAFAVSIWRGVALHDGATRLLARVKNADGSISAELSRDVAFVSGPWNVELVESQSNLVADGASRPVIAVRLTDRQGRPVRDGVSGAVAINAPYESAAMLDRLQLGQLTGQGTQSPNWTIDGDDGIARIELAPTMISGPLHLEFNFSDERVSRRRELESWVVPGDLEWTVIGLAEGSVGERSVADNMEKSGTFESDLGDNARVALYAKGRVLGKFLLTLAYDSAKQQDDQRLLGTIDPNAYYTVFGDGSDRRFDAASREKLYVRVETSTFYALYGDFTTGFDQTVLTRYQRTMTGAKAEGRLGAFHAQAFAAKTATRFRRDEIQGAGTSGPYRLTDRSYVPNSERVALEIRDRFRSEVIVARQELSRFIDYDIDVLSGTISFKEPVLSRDPQLNPQFIVIDYEVDEGRGEASWTGGARVDYTFGGDRVRLGATAITDEGGAKRTDLVGLDARVRVGSSTEVRGEFAASRNQGETTNAWLVEAEHRSGSLDLLAYAREVEPDFGSAQINGAESGRRKVGLDARYAFTDKLSLTASAWQDDSLIDDSRRKAAQLAADFRSGNTDVRVGITHFGDRLATGERADSTVLEGSVSQRLFGNRLELGASTSVALDKPESIDLPTRHRLRARYSVTDWLRLVGSYEIANGDAIEARTVNGGVEISPWGGARVLTTLGQQNIGELGKRSFAAFGLSQSLPVTESLTIDATVDGNHRLSGGDPLDVINPEQPVASGGQISQDGTLFEDFTAVTLGASWRHDLWAATARGEYRDGKFADRRGVTAALLRQIGNGVIVGSGINWTRANAADAAETEVLDAAVSAAFRPSDSAIALLGKLEFRSDRVAGAVEGETGPAGRTALAVTGNARSQRLVASLSANWSPSSEDRGELVRRTDVGLFVGGRYGLDRFEGFDLSGTMVMGGLDARFGIGERIEVGATATVRASLEDNVTSFSFGPQIGFVPAKNTLLTVGYNMAGFRDADFSATRNTDRGLYASVRLKLDADSFGFLGLGRR